MGSSKCLEIDVRQIQGYDLTAKGNNNQDHIPDQKRGLQSVQDIQHQAQKVSPSPTYQPLGILRRIHAIQLFGSMKHLCRFIATNAPRRHPE
jgi:hypothetical protein